MKPRNLSVTELLKHSAVVEDNIMEIYEQHTLDDLVKGKEWYSEAHSFAVSLSNQYGISVMVACGIIAALSPQKEWNLNKIIANLYFQEIYKHTGTQIQKCRNIEKCKTVEEINEVLGGLKTINFFNNIYDPRNPDYVCIDRHIAKVATGMDIEAVNKKQYELIKSVYICLAKKLGILPVDLQSICWVTYKRIKKFNSDVKYRRQH